VPAASFAAIYVDSAPPAVSLVAEYRHSRAVNSADDLPSDTASNSFRNLAPNDDYHDIRPQILSNNQKFPGTENAVLLEYCPLAHAVPPRY
jgi:hypothetical protein